MQNKIKESTICVGLCLEKLIYDSLLATPYLCGSKFCLGYEMFIGTGTHGAVGECPRGLRLVCVCSKMSVMLLMSHVTNVPRACRFLEGYAFMEDNKGAVHPQDPLHLLHCELYGVRVGTAS